MFNALAALAIIPLGLGWLHWHYNRGPRVSVWLFGAAFFLLALGVVPWTDTLIASTATPTSWGVLGGMLAVSLAMAFWEGIHKPREKEPKDGVAVKRPRPGHYSRIRTMIVFAVFGTSSAVAVVRLSDLATMATGSPAAIGKGITDARAMASNGQAAKAVSTGERHLVWLAVIAILIAIAIYLWKMEHRKHSRGGRQPKLSRRDQKAARKAAKKGGFGQALPGGGFGQPVLPAGRRGQALPRGQRGQRQALPMGSGHWQPPGDGDY
jgi:hypothetical protein